MRWDKIMASFRGRIRRWREDKPGGLAVIDIPLELVAGLGGRRQMRVAGSLNGVPFVGSTMLVAGGGFCVGVSRAALKASGVSEGDEVEIELQPARSELWLALPLYAHRQNRASVSRAR
jgi:hypothetical protein